MPQMPGKDTEPSISEIQSECKLGDVNIADPVEEVRRHTRTSSLISHVGDRVEVTYHYPKDNIHENRRIKRSVVGESCVAFVDFGIPSLMRQTHSFNQISAGHST